MNESTEKNLQQEVLCAIKDGEITMRPRWQFVLRGTLAVLGGVLIALALLYLISLIIFMSRQTGAAFVPAFGLRGVLSFLRELPWLLVSLSLLFIVLLEILVRRYSFAYSRPLVYSVLGIMVIVVGGGFVVASTTFHRGLADRAERHQLPFGEGFYRGMDQIDPFDIHRGIITATTTSGFLMKARRGHSFVVTVSSSTAEDLDGELAPGRMVVIFGDVASDTIEAIGVRVIGDRD